MNTFKRRMSVLMTAILAITGATLIIAPVAGAKTFDCTSTVVFDRVKAAQYGNKQKVSGQVFFTCVNRNDTNDIFNAADDIGKITLFRKIGDGKWKKTKGGLSAGGFSHKYKAKQNSEYKAVYSGATAYSEPNGAGDRYNLQPTRRVVDGLVYHKIKVGGSKINGGKKLKLRIRVKPNYRRKPVFIYRHSTCSDDFKKLLTVRTNKKGEAKAKVPTQGRRDCWAVVTSESKKFVAGAYSFEVSN